MVFLELSYKVSGHRGRVSPRDAIDLLTVDGGCGVVTCTSHLAALCTRAALHAPEVLHLSSHTG